MYEIMIGRNEADKRRFGDKGAFLLARHYVKMGQTTSLSANIHMDALRPHVVFVVGKRGSGKCVTGDTLVPLSDGRIVQVKDLENDTGQVLALNSELKMTAAGKSAFFRRTVNKILKVILKSGKEIKLTPEHPLLTISGWQKASDLSGGSRIATPRRLDNFGNKPVPESEVKLLAYLIAEGHLKQGVLFANMDDKIIAEFKEALHEFDPFCELVKLKEGDYRVYTRGRVSGKTRIREFLELHGLKGKLSGDKFIPEKIMQLPRKLLAVFLNRLFTCDGSIYKSRKGKRVMWQISYSSKSERLIREVQHLLLRFDVVARLRNKITRINDKEIPSFELVFDGENLLNFCEQIGFISHKAVREEIAIEETVVVKRNPNVDTVPKGIWNLYRPESWAQVGREMGYKHPKSLRESVRYSPGRAKLLQIASVVKDDYLYKLATSDIFWDEIRSIEEISGSFEVFDLSVPEYHNFVANDIIVHNSYTSGAMAESMMLLPPEVTENLSIIMLDTMGIFWTMKYENREDAALLKQWHIGYQPLNIQIYTPAGFYPSYKEKGISDFPFSIRTSELSVNDWLMTFGLGMNDPVSIVISRAVSALQEKGSDYSVKEIIGAVNADARAGKNEREAAENLFGGADKWGLFDEKGTKFGDLVSGGQITILDVSCYASLTGVESIRSLVIGLVSKKLFEERMSVRKFEELAMIKSKLTLESQRAEKRKLPLIWIMVDEAHEFLPFQGHTAATDALLTLLREGRQPGISLVLATQQPGKIHTDVMTQSDIIIAHRLTSKIDIDSLGLLMQSYMRENVDKLLAELPDVKGAALIFDDTNERMYNSQIRPKMTWHGGSSPIALSERKELWSSIKI
ncbi:hypothetical protein HYY74_06890 [Candidatus Woesearchaeota archaeon]|nr:hypothetical protein [Candidatus Woesearchaeota archaeon]